MLVFGRQGCIPMDTGLKLLSTSNMTDVREVMVTLANPRRKIMESAGLNLRRAHAKMKARHDAKSGEHDYKPGDYVYLYVPGLLVPHTSKKLQSQYSGPYMIVKFTSTYNCTLMRCQDGKVSNKAVHIERLRKPRVKDKSFLKRLIMGPLGELYNPDLIIDAELSDYDRHIMGIKSNTIKKVVRLGKAHAGRHLINKNAASIFNAKHDQVAFAANLRVQN